MFKDGKVKMMRIGIVSDIHGSFFTLLNVVKQMGDINLLIHAGDGANDIIRLQEKYPFKIEAVRGNCDVNDIFPEEVTFNLDRYRIFLCHGHQYAVKLNRDALLRQAKVERADIVIYGHTHQAEIHKEAGILFINPGSLSFARSYGGPSYAMLEISSKGELSHWICRIGS